MGQPNWNVEFWKKILKSANNQAWPNLIMQSSLRLGDYGPLRNVSNGLQYVGNIIHDGIQVDTRSSSPSGWSLSYGNFTEVNTGGTIKGDFWDPDPEFPNMEHVGVEYSWTFNGGESIIANLAQVNSLEFYDSISIMQGIGPSSKLFQAAATLGYTKNNQIKPGFALVTSVYTIVAGMVICTTVKGQTFNISGFGKGMTAFMDGDGGGYYNYVSQLDDTNLFIHPPNGVTQSEEVPSIASDAAQAPIAYLAWTWDGKGSPSQCMPHN